jgi:hypothetical protein
MTIATATFEIDQLRGDLLATEYLLSEMTAERDELHRKNEQLTGELAESRARSYAEPSR